MNERIKELYKQAGLTMNNPLAYEQWYLDSLEKFAELIVRECVDVVQKEVSLKYKNGGENEEFMNGHYAGSLLARVKIKEHFGVKNERAN